MSLTKKIFILAIAVLLVVPMSSYASYSRVAGLGGGNTLYIIHDAFEPSIYPQLAYKYAGLFGAEFSGSNQFMVWGHYDFGEENGTWKVWLDNTTAATFGNIIPPSIAGNGEEFHRLGMAYSRPLGDMYGGIAIRYEGQAMEKKETAAGALDDVDASYSSMGVTLGLTAAENTIDAALDIDFASFSEAQGAWTDDYENDGTMKIAARARYWYAYSDQSTLIPHFRFLNKKEGSKQGDYSDALTTTDIVIGLGHNWVPVENSLVVFELGFDMYSDKYEYDTGTVSEDGTNSDTRIYWRLGAETKILDWLNGRFGAERTWKSLKEEWDIYATPVPGPDPQEPTYSYVCTETYIGATTHWKRLYIDFIFNPQWFSNGPYFISGAPGNLSGRISAWFKLK